RDGTPRGGVAARAGGKPLDRLGRPGRAVSADPSLCRARPHPSRISRSGPRPGPLPEALRRAGPAIAACQAGVMTQKVTLSALSGIKLIEPGDDLCAITVAALRANGLVPEAGDVLVVAQKIVSKAEGRYVDTARVQPSQRAIALAAEIDKDP